MKLANSIYVGVGWRFHCNVCISNEKMVDLAIFLKSFQNIRNRQKL